ncbi:toxin-antitoxin system toxin subunit [Calidifontibacter sp. DB0510]|uniref:Toxin-antitoxin system toxin subunit n=1 Tax=Metallococcus carri TaxID=1656884 RepID=A0A967B1C1_9MICO|nr:nucleotidyltransferase domain-containing protein [Metallococcus carri]NHN55465.1 toxin-antitoxin system toxin subunit [Metallococcus carri]NOP38351.1 toxin-antitoxin system toxin subunit [Calidifontibacter sp. DB2511S]
MDGTLAEVARRSDEAIAAARADLVHAVRRAASAGMSQSQIAASIGRSQPEVSRLLHFHGTSPLARALRRHARTVRHLIAAHGGRNVRVFGSVATGKDHAGSDIDLVFAIDEPLSLMELGRLEQKIADVLGAPVDLVPEDSLRPQLREKVLTEAVPL